MRASHLSCPSVLSVTPATELTAWEALMPRGSVPLKVLVRPGLTAVLALLT